MSSSTKISKRRKDALCIRHLAFKYMPTIAFLASLIVYWLTVDSGASYWDCPEYLITALRLEVGHPPGNPGWALTHRVASCLFTDPATQVRIVNMMSGLFTALAVMLLCSISITLMRRIWPGNESGSWRVAAISVSSLAGSLCFAWSDSAWYSAVEAEVYAMSLFLSSLTVWMALKWAFSFGRGRRTRWMVALFYVIGFSLGVHQLNLLALPAIAMIMGFRIRSGRRAGFARISLAFITGCLVVVLILKGLMPGAVALAGKADILAVNLFSMPYWSGAIVFWLLSLSLTVALAVMAGHKRKYWKRLSVALWCLAAVMTGFSVYIVIPIRAHANPPVNEGNPSDPFRIADYLGRRQYPSSPLLHGHTPYSRIMRMERVSITPEGDTLRDYSWNAMRLLGRDMRPMIRGARIPERSRFMTDSDRRLNERLSADSARRGYVVAGYRTEPVYTPELDMWLPRIYSSSPGSLKAYADWTGMDTSNMVRVRISEAVDSAGKYVPMRDASGHPAASYSLRPSYLQSLAYLFGYQIGYMYLRYLMWNFSGRQNDVASTGEIDHGNFITGIQPIDDLMLGPQTELPPELGRGNKGHNVYFMIPFLLGLAGIILLFRGAGPPMVKARMRRTAWVSLVLFLMTGIAIVVYLNQSPGEPRERDYSFMGSFWTFALWIAFGMLAVVRRARTRWVRHVALAAICAVPLWMLAENLDDHDRSRRSATLDYASNLLESLDEDAILFVDGDNYIFPLWFAQEVMGIRRDVTVVCNAYLVCDWYVRQLMTGAYDREPLSMTAREGDISLGYFNMWRLPSLAATDTLDAVDALSAFYSDPAPTPVFPSGFIRMAHGGPTIDLRFLAGKSAGSLAGLRELAVIDIVATNASRRYPRPVYWHQALGSDKYYGFHPYTRQALFTRRLIPDAPDSLILTDESLDALPKLKWGGLDRAPYPGPDVEKQAAHQRASLIRLAEALVRERRYDQALHIMRSAMVRFPERTIPFSIHRHDDSAYFESRSLARILIEAGMATGDSTALRQADDIMRSDSIRVSAFSRYRRALPAARRSALSPESGNHSIAPSRR